MAKLRRVLLITAVPVILIINGVGHGVLTDRWGGHEPELPAERAAALPMVLGDWDGTTIDMADSPYPEEMIRPSLVRRYVSRSSGSTVTILLTWGRTGPLAVHTPRECYGGLGYQYTPPTRRTFPPGPAERPAEFWVARFSKPEAAAPEQLRIFWAWNATGRWEAANDPRLAFWGKRTLYRLYVIRQMARAEEPLETDPALQFIPLLLQALEKVLG